jgi:phosphate-selective porin OprO/OprP
MKSLGIRTRTVKGALASFAALAMFTSVAAADAVAGKEIAVPGGGKTVTQEVLEILKRSGTISAAKYKELSRRLKAEEASSKTTANPDGWSVRWKNGTRVESNDGRFKIKFGGRLMLDFAQIWKDRDLEAAVPGNTGSGVEVRRARLYFSGTLYERFIFKVNLGFANVVDGTVEMKDLYLGLTKLGPVGTVRIGHMKEDFSLEEMTSSKYIVFMERALPSVFNPARNTGISAYNSFLAGRIRYAVGGFHETNSSGFGFPSDDDDPNYTAPLTTYHITARLTGLPLWLNKGETYIHLGADYSHQFVGNRDHYLRYRERPEAHLANRYVNTKKISANNIDAIDLFTGEFAFGWKSLSAQAEYQGSLVSRSGAAEDLYFWGVYGQVSWFATGERRSYNRKYGNFGRIKLKQNFDPAQGQWGAWELAARVSFLDLNEISRGVQGGELLDITGGVNWYLWPNVRIMANYVHSIMTDGENGEGNGDLFEMRFQVDF